MRDFFKSLPFKLFVAAAAVLIGLMLRSAYMGGSAGAVGNVLSAAAYPFQKASGAVSGFFYNLFSGIATNTQLKAENAKLKEQLSSMRSQMVDYNELQQENSQYQKMYGIAQENPDYKMTPARVISRDPGQWSSAITIDKGSADGIAAGMPVITSDGLVGETVSVTATSAVVRTILDPTSKIGAVISQTGELVQARGDRTLVSDGTFYLDYLAKDSTATAGDIIVTAGRTGSFPKNLKIGLIEKIKTQDQGTALYAVCKPLTDPNTVTDVSVVTDYSGKAASSSSSASSK